MMKNKGTALIIFAKSPVPGQVKTRLIPELGQEKATALYEELLLRTINTSIKSNANEVQLWISGNDQHPFFKKIKSDKNIMFYKQKGHDLGKRMFNAFEFTLKQYSIAVLIGSDCPELSSTDIDKASELLENGKDIVLGPAHDGGYYLIALKKNNLILFSDIEWGEESVFNDTCTRAKSLNMEVGILERRNDVDRPDDLYLLNKSNGKELVY
jgi:uncharacterized protein